MERKEILIVVKKFLLISISPPLTVITVLLLMVDSPQAQSREAFDSLEIGVQYVVNTNRNVFHDFWAPGRGIDAFIETPFYYGAVQAGLHAFPFYSRESGVPDFQIVFIYLKWGQRWTLLNKLDWFNHIGVGSNIMIFEKEPGHARHESELGVSLNSGVSYPFYRNIAINLSGSYNIIFTRKRIKLAFVSAGMSYSLSTPGWLKAFLE